MGYAAMWLKTGHPKYLALMGVSLKLGAGPLDAAREMGRYAIHRRAWHLRFWTSIFDGLLDGGSVELLFDAGDLYGSRDWGVEHQKWRDPENAYIVEILRRRAVGLKLGRKESSYG